MSQIQWRNPDSMEKPRWHAICPCLPCMVLPSTLTSCGIGQYSTSYFQSNPNPNSNPNQYSTGHFPDGTILMVFSRCRMVQHRHLCMHHWADGTTWLVSLNPDPDLNPDPNPNPDPDPDRNHSPNPDPNLNPDPNSNTHYTHPYFTMQITSGG